MSLESAIAPVESASGTPLRQAEINVPGSAQNPSDPSFVAGAEQDELLQDGEEQALESHEVIELQTFSERKAWIEEKIKFLEKMPPIEVFVGLEALKSSSEEVPGLPTRSELQKWLVEHDKIEKETEIFDSGELKKLKKFTKAATQRNLSPEDTDLIELTLTTIYELDKLLHLLRDRSEHLDLLGTRLTWEENRIAGWSDRRIIIADLQTFLETRARWSPSAYNAIPKPDEIPVRRGSVASLASMASDSSFSSIPGFSRSARFKLAELLSRDAAQFGARVTSLKHGKISSAGKALDKLIDNSRKPVPEELLDEQDRLEEKGINELENVGKFVMNLVMQWRKADEIYVETMKDQTTAQNLLEEIETAKLHHPTARQSTSFVSRADALVKRLSLRGIPTASTSTFPRPVHPLFPDQQASNDTLAQSLSLEVTTAMGLAKSVDTIAKEYRTAFEAVRNVESLTQTANDLLARLTSLTDRLEEGVVVSDGDGTPPDLTSELCLEATRHAAFLALLPSLLDDLTKVDENAGQLLRGSHVTLLKLDRPGVDPSFKTNAASVIQSLAVQREKAQAVRDDVTARVLRLRMGRKIWAVMGEGLKELEDIRRLIGDVMDKQRWRQQTGRGTTPLTPESPSAILLPSTISPAEAVQHLDDMQARLARDVDLPLSSLSGTLETPLHEWLMQSSMGLRNLLENVKQMARLLEVIKRQASVMGTIQEEVHDLQIRAEDLKIRFDCGMKDVLDGKILNDELSQLELELTSDAGGLQTAIQAFSNGLSERVPFVSQQGDSSRPKTNFVKRRFSSGDLKLGATQRQVFTELPFDLTSLDDAVRTDSNSYDMRLSGEMRSLNQKGEHFRLSRMAKEVDLALSHTVNDIHRITRELVSLRTSLTAASEQCQKMDILQTLYHKTDEYWLENRATVARSFSPIRDLLRRMDSAPGAQDPAIHEILVLARSRAVDDAELKLNAWVEDVALFKNQISEMQRAEAERLEQERIAEERRLQAERERLEEEENKERERIETERQEKEKEQLEKQRQEKEALRKQRLEEQLERERLEQEQIEKERLEQEQIEKERLERERLERAEEERRKEQEERERIGMERLEREQRERDRSEKKAMEREQADVFGLRVAPSSSTSAMTQEASDLQVRILALRKRLRSISINEVARPSSASSSPLPTQDHREKMQEDFLKLSADVARLPASVDNMSVNAELQSLRSEVEASAELMQRVHKLAELSEAVHSCDLALSDLLEHIDSYPAAPLGPLSSSHVSETRQPPEEQLSSRMSFTKAAVSQMSARFAAVSDDSRARMERERILQTWCELEDMGNDRINGRKSRPASVISSGRNSNASVVSSHSSGNKKKGGYSNLSAASSSRGRFLAPSHPTPRRIVSGETQTSRSSSRMSTMSSHRSISGPMFSPSSNLYSSTFASRQRTTSLSSNTSSVAAPAKIPATPSRPRAQTGQKKRSSSPTLSETSSLSRSAMAPSRSSTSMPTWARAPRQSFSTLPRVSTPPKRTPVVKKTYVANPKNKLDVAVGDVVNKLPVNINVEVLPETWKDQSGKYWIGDQEPKLCFCRILRSQTVMVRVGGGWTELSKFIKDHFADLFRLIPESPPRRGTREEKWISSATLLEAQETVKTPPLPPRTPEPKGSFVPSFSLSTPSGQSPHSLKSTPSSGSPLTPLQFMRRADDAPGLRPITPSKMPSLRPRNSVPNTPSRNSVWRP